MYTELVDTILKYLGVRLHTRYKTSPIHLTRIVSAFGIKLEHMPFDKDISGMFVRSNKGTYIFINSLHHFNRRRFSLGHEFGHYCLNHPSDVSTLLQEDANRQYEIEANRFSSCLLMPVQLIGGLAKQDMRIIEIAKWLRVSVIAAAIRCRELGYRVDEADEIISQYWLEIGDNTANDEFSLEQVAYAHEPA